MMYHRSVVDFVLSEEFGRKHTIHTGRTLIPLSFNSRLLTWVTVFCTRCRFWSQNGLARISPDVVVFGGLKANRCVFRNHTNVVEIYVHTHIFSMSISLATFPFQSYALLYPYAHANMSVCLHLHISFSISSTPSLRSMNTYLFIRVLYKCNTHSNRPSLCSRVLACQNTRFYMQTRITCARSWAFFCVGIRPSCTQHTKPKNIQVWLICIFYQYIGVGLLRALEIPLTGRPSASHRRTSVERTLSSKHASTYLLYMLHIWYLYMQLANH